MSTRSTKTPSKKPSHTSSKLWSEYFNAQGTDQKPSRLLVRALREMKVKSAHALDIGCGRGFDTCHLLKKGFSVTAIDNQPYRLKLLQKAVPAGQRRRLTVKCKSFHEIVAEDFKAAQLIIASMSLFLCAPYRQRQVWRRLVRNTVPGTVIAIDFLGVKDSWANNRSKSAQSRAELKAMLADFEVREFDERCYRKQTLTGGEKRWHFFSVIARKR